MSSSREAVSIVISGWPAVGKTTIAGALADEFHLNMYNGGDILKMLAAEKGYSGATARDDWWDTEEAKKFMRERRFDPSFDKKVDSRLANILEKGGAVITSYTLPWLVAGRPSIIKFWLKGSPENRSARMANRDRIQLSEARKVIEMRDEENRKIYHHLYGFTFGEDLSVFDYMLNTDVLSLDSLVEVSKLIVRRHAIVVANNNSGNNSVGNSNTRSGGRQP